MAAHASLGQRVGSDQIGGAAISSQRILEFVSSWQFESQSTVLVVSDA